MATVLPVPLPVIPPQSRRASLFSCLVPLGPVHRAALPGCPATELEAGCGRWLARVWVARRNGGVLFSCSGEPIARSRRTRALVAGSLGLSGRSCAPLPAGLSR